MKKIFGTILCVMLGFCGLAFSACTPNYDNVSMSLSTNKIEMAVGETQTFNLQFENAPNSFSTDVHLGNVNSLFSVVSSVPEDNKVFFEIKAIKTGKTTVQVLSYEAGKTATFDVEVFEPATSFEAKTGLYIVAENGNRVTLANQSYFNFLPANCKAPQMQFMYNDREVAALVVEADQNGKNFVKLQNPDGENLTDANGGDIKFAQGEIILSATPLDYTTGAPMTSMPGQEVQIQIVPQIETGDIRLLRKGGILSSATKYYDEANKFVVGNDDVVTIIKNKISDSYLVFEVECDTPDVQMSISSNICECTEIAPNNIAELEGYASSHSNSKFFSVQGTSVGTDKIKITLRYTSNTTFGQTTYEKQLSFDVVVITSPYQINANNIAEWLEPVAIYDNTQTPYAIFVNVLDKLSSFESVKVSLATKNLAGDLLESDEYFEYLNITYKNQTKTAAFEIPFTDFANNTSILPINILAQNVFAQPIFVVLTVQPLQIEGAAPIAADVQTIVPVQIKEGIKSFTLADQYTIQQGGLTLPKTLYLDVDGGAKVFDGFEIINLESVELADFDIEYKTGDESILKITQITEHGARTKKLELVPHKTGFVQVRITAQDGFFADLEFQVVKSLSGATLSVNPSEDITQTTADANGNIAELQVAYTGENTLMFAITKKESDATLFALQSQVDKTQIADVAKVQNGIITVRVLDMTQDDEFATLSISLAKKEVSENFEIIDTQNPENNITFTVKIYVYCPIESLQFVQTKQDDAGKPVETEISGFALNRLGDVGYKYDTLAKAQCDFRVTLTNGDVIENVFSEYDGAISVMTSYGALISRGENFFINQFGDFAISGNTLLFNCNYDAALTGTFVFTITLTHHNVSHSAALSINVKTFTPLEYVGITNYQETLYLSGTNDNFTFFTYMDPLADIQKFDVVFVPSAPQYANLVNVSVNGDCSQVYVQHNSTVANGSGTLYFVPRTMFAEGDTFPTDRVQKVKVVYSDGTDEAFPELISTAQEFMTAITQTHTAAKHYLIISSIDLAGYTFENVKPLAGSISGGNANAKLVNVNLQITDKNAQSGINNFGLFPSILAGAKLNDLVIEGSINVAIENLGENKTYNIGLVAGENLGELNNISVRLENSNVALEDNATSNKIFVGGIVGTNSGTIQNGHNTHANKSAQMFNFKNTIFNLTSITTIGAFEASYAGKSVENGFGGVVGKNLGTITRAENQKSIFNNNNYTQIINISSVGFAQTGGVVGQNGAADNATACIQNQAISGTISAIANNGSGGQNVGGVAGANFAIITAATMRAQISAVDFVGGIVGLDNAPQNAQNNKVQAAKAFNVKPLLTAISSGGNIGAFCGNVLADNAYLANGNVAQCFFEIDLAQKRAPMLYHFLNGAYQMASKGAFIETTDAIAITGITETSTAQKFDKVVGVGANQLANMFIFVAENPQEQSLVNHLNTNRDIPFVFAQADSIIITSLSPEILSIDGFGKITLYKTGVATLQIQSVLDTSITNKVFINVSTAFDAMKIQTLSGDEIASGAFINVFNHSPASIKFSFTAQSILAAGDMGQIVEVQFANASEPTVNIQYEVSDYYYTTAQKYGNMIIFTSTNQTLGTNHLNSVSFTPSFEVSFIANGSNISATMTNFDTISQNIGGVEIDVLSKLGTQSISSNFADASVEPVDDLNLEIIQITDFEDDTLDFAAVKITDNIGGPQDYFKIKSQQKTQTFNPQTNTYQNVYALKIAFDYNKYSSGYEGVYYLSFTAQNGKSLTIIANLATQNIESVSLKNYYDIDTTYQIGGKESNQVSSGDYNLMEVNLYPYFADYDYIVIKNHEENYDKNNVLLMQVMMLDTQNNFVLLPGVEYLPDGIVISKDVMTSQKLLGADVARLFVRYTTVSKATVDTQAKIVVSTYKSPNQTPITENILPLNVVVKDSVFFTIDAREDADEYYLARGLTYDLSLNIYGFTEDQVKIEITHEGIATTAARVQKIDGQYQLVIAKNITYTSASQNQQGFAVEITTYAENIVDGIRYQSGRSTMKIIIVDFVILQQNLGAYNANEPLSNFDKSTLISGATGATVGLAVGNPFALANEFVFGQTIEFDETNDEIFNRVQNFEDSLSQNGGWTITAVDMADEVLGKFVQSLQITSQTNLTSNYLRIAGHTITPLRINECENTKYYLSYQGAYHYQLGQAVFGQNANAFDVSTDFVLDVYPNSSLENAIPVNNVQEFLAMSDNAHYILMEDITLPTNFAPLETAIASFDGNGHTIALPANLLFEEGDRFGLFATLNEGAVLKNITLSVPSITTIIISNNEATIAFGALVGENNGIITNCKIVGGAFAQLSVSLPNQSENAPENYVAGLVGINNGFITNSFVSVDMSAAANVSGFVGINNGKVSSSFVRESMIVNKSSNSSHKTAGFAITNGSSANSNAAISGCYVAGATSTTSIYSKTPTKSISSMPSVAGFVYSNFNSIQDCYSDILINASSICAGFVKENSGHIARAYTTSTFSIPGQVTYIFVQSNRIDGGTVGTYEDCFFLVGNVNAQANKQLFIDGLTALNDTDFANASNFENFAISSNINKTEGVWFWPAKGVESEFKTLTANLSFTFGRPELVAANLLANTQKVLDAENTTTSPETGETIYSYIETKAAAGSVYNPILIHSAETFESYLNGNAIENVVSANFRIISDIDYRDSVNISQTHKLKILGTIEGNNMEISGFSIDTREKADAKGLFSQIGQSGVVKNLVLSPYYLNTPNAKAAGTLAGALTSGKVFNILCDGFSAQSDGVKVVGQNAVGGVIGIASGSFKMQNITSSVSANASFSSALSKKQFTLFQTASNLENVSCAGGVVGIAHSGGKIVGAKFENNGSAIAEVCGLVFGVIGKNVEVKNIVQEVTENHSITPLVYGGVIAGMISGTLQNIHVLGETAPDFIKKADTSATSAIAAGGICGLLCGGTIQNANIEINLVWNIIAPQNIGGVAGDMIGGNITAVQFDGNILANASNNAYNITSISVGGIVGRLAGTIAAQTQSSITPTNAKIAFVVTQGKINLNLVNVMMIYAGGAVGQVVMVYDAADTRAQQDGTQTIFKTLPRATHTLVGVQNNMDIETTCTIYGGVLTTYVGGLVGATFADNTKLYAGEIVIFDKATENALLGNYQSLANGKINVSVVDNKSSAQLVTWFGGILGYGNAVSSHTTLIGKYDYKNKPWGVLLETSQTPANKTSPEYAGKWEDEDCTVRAEFLKTEYITLPAQTGNIQTRYTENALI
ncbi:MAG: hypothetical protein IKB21_01640 [Clostridia bacterium]|nr:hypothetical protein [Clostridia bacterium]